jgi:hypothetical protein
MVFRCEVLFLEPLDLVSHLSLQILEAEQPGQGGVVSAQVELLPIEVRIYGSVPVSS